jgi:hypothetical protein
VASTHVRRVERCEIEDCTGELCPRPVSELSNETRCDRVGELGLSGVETGEVEGGQCVTAEVCGQQALAELPDEYSCLCISRIAGIPIAGVARLHTSQTGSPQLGKKGRNGGSDKPLFFDGFGH